MLYRVIETSMPKATGNRCMQTEREIKTHILDPTSFEYMALNVAHRAIQNAATSTRSANIVIQTRYESQDNDAWRDWHIYTLLFSVIL